MTRKWFQLVGEDGSALTSADAVSVDIEDVVALRDAVKLKYADSDLAGIAPSDLIVFDANGVVLPKSSSSVSELGKDKDNAIIVQVPRRAEVSLSTPAMNLLEVILPHILANAPTTPTERDGTFKERLCEYYGCFRRGCDACCPMLLFQGRS
ncbi:unnamed protein product [Phytophthora lilii]|uniref:Unnamed protein product n=1 Tax=Phytophthora lilii TaxID=2077276 RepID=A0A9W6UAQ7_9STRA|nr:unnamed protein product [Phytophthora lilii]